jgi:hypothetical protein
VKIFFENLTPLYSEQRINLEAAADNLSARVMDLMTPIGKGTARPHRRAAAHRQDDAAAEHREPHQDEPSRGASHRAAHRARTLRRGVGIAG